MLLFDEILRTFTGPAPYGESHFDYYNRSARSDITALRDLLEKWFADYPDVAKPDVRARFRSGDDGAHYGAFAELYCYTYGRGIGFRPEVHPHVHGKKQPDFSLFRDDKFLSFLEVTVATEFREGGSTNARLHALYDALNNLESPDFFIGIDVITYPTKSVSAARLRKFLSEKLKDLNPDVVGPEMQRSPSIHESPYYWTWEDEDCSLAFYPIPKADEARGKPGIRPLGAFSSGGQFARRVDDRTPLLNALEKKAKRYGNLDASYIIAIDAMESGVDTFDVVGALFGEEQIIFRTSGPSSRTRAPNGLWHGPKGARNKQVSAVLFLGDISPWSITKISPMLWHNPWATHPIALENWAGPQQVPNRTTMQMEPLDGRQPHDIFGLPLGWPTPDAAWIDSE